MRTLLVVWILGFALILQADLAQKISKTKEQLHSAKTQSHTISRKLSLLTREIEEQNRKLRQLSGQIAQTQKKIKTLRKSLNIKSDKLKKMESLYKALKKREDAVNRQLSDLLSQQIAISMIYEQGDQANMVRDLAPNSDELIFKEVLQTYSKLLQAKFAKTKTRFEKIRKNRQLIQSELAKIDKKLNALQLEQRKLDKLKNLQRKTVKNLRQKKKSYQRKLARIIHEQKALASLLQKLHITQKEQARTRIKETKTDLSVRRLGSSYQKGKIVHYKGRKTIAPLKSYQIVQKFGTFIDPVYKIKVFNDSVKLKPTSKDTMVRNVLPGRVVYAAKTPVMDHVVIVEHPGGLHTIYANLSKIAPTLKRGSKLKTGYVIGRINDTLAFEVTKETNHINPLELFR